MQKRKIGWTVYIVECADGSYFGGMCRDLKKKIYRINHNGVGYFTNRPDRLPIKLVYRETERPFREALAKATYMREMNRKLKEKVIRTGVWPMGGPWKEYLRECFERGKN